MTSQHSAAVTPRPQPPVISQETLTGMVVVSGQCEDTAGTPDNAMSCSDAEDELIEPSTPTPSSASFSLHGKLHPLQVRLHARSTIPRTTCLPA